MIAWSELVQEEAASIALQALFERHLFSPDLKVAVETRPTCAPCSTRESPRGGCTFLQQINFSILSTIYNPQQPAVSHRGPQIDFSSH